MKVINNAERISSNILRDLFLHLFIIRLSRIASIPIYALAIKGVLVTFLYVYMEISKNNTENSNECFSILR